MKFFPATLTLAFFLTGKASADVRGGRELQSRSRTGESTSASEDNDPAGFVFTMTNAADGNEIVMYTRDGTTGRLGNPRHFATGGLGGDEVLEAPPDDPLASQDALVVSGDCLLAVNAGSDTVTSFEIRSSRVEAVSVVGSGGDIPVGIAAHDGLVYVLNSGGPGSIKGFNLDDDCHLVPINNSIVSLNQAPRDLPPPPDGPPYFVSSPAQVGFTPDGSELIVTIKGIDGNPLAGGTINRFEVDDDGHLGEISVFESGESSIVPFSFDFDRSGHLIVVDAFGSSPPGSPEAGHVTLYNLDDDGITSLDNIGVGATAVCWLKYNNGCAYTTNNGSSSISSIRVSGTSLSLVHSEEASLNNPVDLQFSDDGDFLYVISTGHTTDGQPRIYVYERNNDCTLDQVQVIDSGLPDEDTSVFGVVGLAIA